MSGSLIVHGGCLALWVAGKGWRGVLVQGSSGSGKSDLALRLIDAGFRLVSDDRTTVWASQGRLFGASPSAITGLIEARGLGLLSEPALPQAPILLVVQCEQPAERLPDTEMLSVAGVEVPVVRLSALEASTPVKLRRAMVSLGARA